ncbi:MAG: molybdopterin-guanine dinucleotide biosynthesis protein MobB [Oscillospiraceae bacterium]
MKVIMFKGTSGTGKTTTAERMIAELCRRGYSVGSVKDIHAESFYADTEGTNTDRHRKAGANPVTALGRHDTSVIFGGTVDIEKLLDIYTTDYVVLEGDSGANCPIIITGKTVEDLDEKYNGRVIAVSGVVSEKITNYRGLPIINGLTDIEKLVDLVEEKTPERMPNFAPDCCSGCGGDCRSLLERMLRGYAKPTDCILKNGRLRLFVGDEEIKMVPFVENIVGSVVIGAVKTLRGYRDDREIVVKVRQ